MKTLLRPYWGQIAILAILGLLSNGLGLVLPKLIGSGIDAYVAEQGLSRPFMLEFAAVSGVIFFLTALQSMLQIAAAERVARDLRQRIVEKIAQQSYTFVLQRESAKLLTHLTADVDAVKQFVAQAISSLLASVVILVGASVMLVRLDPFLGMVVLTVVPIIGLTFGLVLSSLMTFFKQAREIVDRLNKIIHDSILGAALIRVLDAGPSELQIFSGANARARDVGLHILGRFAAMIPAVILLSNLAALAILAIGGRRVIDHHLHLGDLAAFNAYLGLLIFPIFIIGFTLSVIGQAQASYERLRDLLEDPQPPPADRISADLKGEVEVRGLSFSYGERQVVQDVSLRLPPGSRTAIVGPTAAGKTQLLYLLIGLLEPQAGEIFYDGRKVEEYDPISLRRQVALVFQESVLFRASLHENVAFRQDVAEEDWLLAVETAELGNFIDALPEGSETPVSERGSSLSGGQKQRVMLARALALRPRVLFLDDFTARLDPETERQVLANLGRNYPGLTLLTVTQRIAPVKDYDHLVLMMEGAVLAQGTHQELLRDSPEYMQIYESQRSTQAYE